jgi:hypothetical protein
MKWLNEGSDTAHDWESRLLKDLSFIKKNMRYPMRGKMLLPIVFWCFFFLVVISVFIFYLYEGADSKIRLFPILGFVLPVTLLFRYWQSLRFVRLYSPYSVLENIMLVERFLKEQQILVYRHSNAPEVLQIISKRISATKDEREFMVFIADEKQILLNSHFTNAGWSFAPARSHAKMMAKSLQRYIAASVERTAFHLKVE